MDLSRLLTAPTAGKRFGLQELFWLSLSFLFAAFFAIQALQQAFSSPYLVQDDARQHVVWMMRFSDPGLFPNDLIADYFQSVAPVGYTALYRGMAWLGITPLLLHKLLPIGLALIVTGYCFFTCLQILPVPMAGFWSALLLNHYLWMRDHLVSASPKAFIYPLFVAFLYYLLRRSLVPCMVALALQGLFYPQVVFVSVGTLVLRLLRWQQGRLSFSREQADYRFCAVGVGVALAVLLPYALKSSEFGPVVTAAEARLIPDFASKGWSEFFVGSPWHYWFTAKRSGIFGEFGTPIPLVVSLVLPVLLRFPGQFPLARQVSERIVLFVQVILASIGMLLVANVFLFKLHLPSRYTEHSLRVLTALAGGIALTLILDALLQWARRQAQRQHYRQQWLAWSLMALLGGSVLLYPTTLHYFPKTNYLVGQTPALYEFMAGQPKETLIASLTEDTNNLPAFTLRPILVGSAGYTLPYHKKYYAQMRQRTLDLMAAQYSPDLKQVQRFIQQYGVDFWLVDRSGLTAAYVNDSKWFKAYRPAREAVLGSLQQGATPALAGLLERCEAFSTETQVVLQADCIAGAAAG